MLKLYFIAFVLVGCSVFSFKRQDGDVGQEWCHQKVHKGITYNLVERGETLEECKDDCIYKTEEDDSKHCFKDGGVEVPACSFSAGCLTTTCYIHLGFPPNCNKIKKDDPIACNCCYCPWVYSPFGCF